MPIFQTCSVPVRINSTFYRICTGIKNRQCSATSRCKTFEHDGELLKAARNSRGKQALVFVSLSAGGRIEPSHRVSSPVWLRQQMTSREWQFPAIFFVEAEPSLLVVQCIASNMETQATRRNFHDVLWQNDLAATLHTLYQFSQFWLLV